MHSTRRDELVHIQKLADAGRWETVYQRSVLWDFAMEARMGFQLAFLRPFAVPRMAQVLVDTGHIISDPEKRAYNTGIIIHEVIAGGLESRRGRQSIAHMNRAHRSPHVLQEDLTYVLCAFIVVPTRYIRRVGWRAITPCEVEAAVRFYQRLGELMNIHRIPSTYDEAATILDEYEARMVAPSAAGQRIGHDVLAVLRHRLPAPARPLAKALFASQLADDRILTALGLSAGPAIVREGLSTAMRARARFAALRPARSRPSFVPGQSAGEIYPNGYRLEDITGSPQ